MNLGDLVIPPWARWAALGIGAAACFAAGFQVESWRWSAAELHAVKKQDKAAQKQRDHANNESSTYERTRQQAREANDARQQQVRTIYRDRPVDRGCEPPDDALRVLDQALAEANNPASQSGGTVSQPSR